jgi:hypothetical protein
MCSRNIVILSPHVKGTGQDSPQESQRAVMIFRIWWYGIEIDLWKFDVFSYTITYDINEVKITQ